MWTILVSFQTKPGFLWMNEHEVHKIRTCESADFCIRRKCLGFQNGFLGLKLEMYLR
jgi:hypothetical protein